MTFPYLPHLRTIGLTTDFTVAQSVAKEASGLRIVLSAQHGPANVDMRRKLVYRNEPFVLEAD